MAKSRMSAMKHYRSSIPKNAQEKVVATYRTGPQKYKVDCVLGGKIVGLRSFDAEGHIESETPLKNGLVHGTVYFFESGIVSFLEPYRNGFSHGTAKQWSEEGELLGTYTMKHGTGWDLWRCKETWGTGSIYLSEARHYKEGKRHGFEWWLDFEDQSRVWQESHFLEGLSHGIERQWNSEGTLSRGYPKYWVKGQRVTKRQYISASSKDPTLPAFRLKDNKPKRDFPPEVKEHCAQKS